MGYRLMRVRVRDQMFEDLETHALDRSAECDRRVYVSDIVRYAVRTYLNDQTRQQAFASTLPSVRDASRRASVVAPEDVQPPILVEAECGLDA